MIPIQTQSDYVNKFHYALRHNGFQFTVWFDNRQKNGNTTKLNMIQEYFFFSAVCKKQDACIEYFKKIF